MTTLRQDARNRAVRTFVQGLALDTLAAVGLVVYGVATAEEPAYELLPALLLKSVLTSAASWLMRLRLDPSSFPTPLPPAPVPAPADDPPH